MQRPNECRTLPKTLKIKKWALFSKIKFPFNFTIWTTSQRFEMEVNKKNILFKKFETQIKMCVLVPLCPESGPQKSSTLLCTVRLCTFRLEMISDTQNISTLSPE
uniref:(northern house mosquito) hypothetical protein n=1 Tax=Culex pipiens TaxID=7175 RepID=A0A8D8BQK7_CULPI